VESFSSGLFPNRAGYFRNTQLSSDRFRVDALVGAYQPVQAGFGATGACWVMSAGNTVLSRPPIHWISW